MNKEEFLQGLRRALSSTGSESLIQENLSFYRSYIDGEMAKNRSEEEVLAELGDPRLIANSIREAAGFGKDMVSGGQRQEEFQDSRQGYRQESREGQGSYERPRGVSNGLILGIVFVLLFFVAVVLIIGGIVTLLAPILVPVSLIAVVFWMLRRRS